MSHSGMPNIGICNIITLTQTNSVHGTTRIFTVWLEVVETLMEVTLANHSILLLVLKQETVTRKKYTWVSVWTHKRTDKNYSDMELRDVQNIGQFYRRSESDWTNCFHIYFVIIWKCDSSIWQQSILIKQFKIMKTDQELKRSYQDLTDPTVMSLNSLPEPFDSVWNSAVVDIGQCWKSLKTLLDCHWQD